MRLKDSYYFPHDSNAKDDPKCMELIEQLGLEGYGIYWVLIETLRDQSNYSYPIKLIPALARRYTTSKEKMAAVVYNYDLFQVDNDEFFLSPSLCRRMGDVNKHRINGIRGSLIKNKRITREQASHLSDNEIVQLNAECRGLLGGLQPATKGLLALNKRKGKEKESIREKSNKRFTPPTQDDVFNYMKSKGLKQSLCNTHSMKFWNHYESNGWRVGKNKMSKWRSAATKWIAEDLEKIESHHISNPIPDD